MKNIDNIFEKFCKTIMTERERAIKVGISTFSLGILLYFSMITKWLTNPDGVWNGLLYKSSYDWEDRLGRFGLKAVSKIKGNFIFPSAQTIFNLIIIALIAILIVILFDVKSLLCGIGIGVFLMCSPSLCSTLTYYYTSDSYIVAYLFSVLFVMILARHKSIACLGISIILLFSSMSLYQAYTGTSITLCLLYVLFLLLHKKETWKTALKTAGRFLLGGFGAVILYLIIFSLYCKKTAYLRNNQEVLIVLEQFLLTGFPS